MRERVFTTFQIADVCGVRPTTIIKWVKQGKMKAYVTPGGHRRVQESDLLDFLKEYNLPIPDRWFGVRRRVSVVEDDAAVATMLKKALQKRSGDVDVTIYNDGIEALIELGKNPPDLVILDVVMPVVDGARVLATLKADENTKKVKVIGITGKRLTSEKMKYMQDNADAFYLKPFDVNTVVSKVLHLLGIQRVNQVLSAKV